MKRTTMKRKPLKARLCANKINGCEVFFVPDRGGQKVCSPKCSIEYGPAVAAEKRHKEIRRKARQWRQDNKTVGVLIQECQRQCFNPWIRYRDRDEPCISCGDFNPGMRDQYGGAWDAGHWLTTGSTPELRFHEDNCHKQCKSCNNPGPNKALWVAREYRINLINKIGIERVQWLEGPHDPSNYTRQDLIELKALFRRKLREAKS